MNDLLLCLTRREPSRRLELKKEEESEEGRGIGRRKREVPEAGQACMPQARTDLKLE
jgi:hypothetical protein